VIPPQSSLPFWSVAGDAFLAESIR
jgi:hypothetical protein